MIKTTHTLVSNDILNLLKFFCLFAEEKTMREITDNAIVEYMEKRVPDIKKRYEKASKKCTTT